MVLVAGGMWLPGYRHEPQAKLDEPTVHALVEAAEPGGGIFIGIMIVEGVDHLSHLVESIHEGGGAVCVPDAGSDLVESTQSPTCVVGAASG